MKNADIVVIHLAKKNVFRIGAKKSNGTHEIIQKKNL